MIEKIKKENEYLKEELWKQKNNNGELIIEKNKLQSKIEKIAKICKLKFWINRNDILSIIKED